MKRYKFKPRFYVIAATAGLMITSFSLIQIDRVCSQNIAEGKVLKPAHIEAEEKAPEVEDLGEYMITHYCSCPICCDNYAEDRPIDENGEEIVYTASGEIAEAGKTIAVDPDVIPLGTTVIINGHEYVAQDVGGAIQGNRIDVYCNSHEEAIERGVIYSTVYKEG